MSNPEPNRPPFDEQAVLAELERLRDQIVQMRSKRIAAGTEFDRFVRSLKSGAAGPDAAGRVSGTAPPPITSDAAARTSEPVPPIDHAIATEPVAAPGRRFGGTGRLVVLAGALAVLAAGTFVTWTLRRGSREAVQEERVVAPNLPATAEPAAAPRAPVSLQPSPYEMQITISRPVWVRVVADGQRIVERELPAQARIPFGATKTIVIRTGDAGAVRLSIGGKDQGALGADGEVVTRSFAVPAGSTK